MTRVSSASSSPMSSVVPRATAARSSRRFEMLLEPGRRTLPAARRAAGRSIYVMNRPGLILRSWKMHPVQLTDADPAFGGCAVDDVQVIEDGAAGVAQAERL